MSLSKDEITREIDRIRKLPWQAVFHKTLTNEKAPGGKVDMYILIDDDTGEHLVALSVPHGKGWIAEYVAGCCADPYFVRAKDVGGKLAAAFNQAISTHLLQPDGTLDAREVHVAAMAMVQAYVGAMPKRSRDELLDNTIKVLRGLRGAP